MVRGLPEVGDVLLTTEAPLGETAQIKDTKVALAQRVILFKANQNLILNDYLKYHFLSSFAQIELYRQSTGSTAVGIKASKLRQTLMVVPPISEQSSIVMVLDKKVRELDVIIKEIHANIEVLKEYRQSLITAAVTGKIDVRDYYNLRSE